MEDGFPFILRYADSRIFHFHADPVSGGPQRNGHFPFRHVVFDCVFHQIEHHMIQIIFRSQYDAVRFKIQLDLHILFGRQRFQEGNGFFRHLCHVYRNRFSDIAVIHPAQIQQFLRHFLKAVAFMYDIGDKFPDRLLVHVLILNDTVCQQGNCGNRCFQLVGSIGNKLSALLLRGLQSLCQTVKLPPKFRHLIFSLCEEALGIVSFCDFLRHLRQRYDPLGKKTRHQNIR